MFDFNVQMIDRGKYGRLNLIFYANEIKQNNRLDFKINLFCSCSYSNRLRRRRWRRTGVFELFQWIGR